ncbi:MAG: dienelactone hydrolase family protein [Alphaproteobacteria bacterium]|nr:dienelactone hydrolase family protein [Alphaproteobacteria bacterium]
MESHVIVPDLFWRIEAGVQLGYDGEDLETARALYGKLDWDLAADDVMTCVDHARAAGGAPVFLLGFCFGGKLATICATRPGIDAAVGYYGVGIEKLGIAGDVACPIMLHFGADDKGTPPGGHRRIQPPAPRKAQRYSAMKAPDTASTTGARAPMTRRSRSGPLPAA